MRIELSQPRNIQECNKNWLTLIGFADDPSWGIAHAKVEDFTGLNDAVGSLHEFFDADIVSIKPSGGSPR